MNAEALEAIAARKAALRRQIIALRREQGDKDSLSSQIAARLCAFAEYQVAGVVMFYVDARSEVRTRDAIRTAIASGKTVAVPQCVGDELVPWRIASLDELEIGAFGIAEPSAELQVQPGRRIDPLAIDLVIVPGVAFDHRRHRLGSGRGCYDRFVARLRPSATLVGLAFDCQVVDAVPTGAHDVPLHIVITPTTIIDNSTRE